MAQHRVLVVEDEQVSQVYFRTLLDRAGFNVTMAANGAEGLYHYLGGTHFDCVLLDLMLPHVSGQDFLKVAEELRASRLIKSIPNIIICSAVVDLLELWKLTSLTCVHAVLEKPVNGNRLMKEMERIIQTSGARSEKNSTQHTSVN